MLDLHWAHAGAPGPDTRSATALDKERIVRHPMLMLFCSALALCLLSAPAGVLDVGRLHRATGGARRRRGHQVGVGRPGGGHDADLAGLGTEPVERRPQPTGV